VEAAAHRCCPHRLVATVRASQSITQKRANKIMPVIAHRSMWCSVSSELERSRLRSSKNSNGDILPEVATSAGSLRASRVVAARLCGRGWVPGGGGFDDCILIRR
jgi:hypothetical protein